MADTWRDLDRWEKDNHAVAFLVVTTEEVREALSYWNAFDTELQVENEFICNIYEVSEGVVHQALLNAYNTLNFDYGITYDDINEACYDYIVDNLSTKTTGLNRGNIYNSETKQFESVKSFLARIGERNAS